MYDLLIYLLGNGKRVLNSTEVQVDFFKAIYVLKTSMKNDITDQSEEQKKKTFEEQESVLNDAEVLLEVR